LTGVRRAILTLLLLALLVVVFSACHTQGRVIVPVAPDSPAAEGPLPLHTAWVKTLMNEATEDRWRPMQYAIPVPDRELVYLGNTNNIFYAFNAADGSVVWSFNTAGPVESGAVVVGDRVIVGDGDGHVYCLDRKNGHVFWTYVVQGQVMGNLASNGELVFIRTTHERLYAVTLADGKWKWMQSRELPPNFTIRGVGSPVVDGDRVINGFADGYLMGFRASDGSEVFKTLLQKGERFTDVDGTPLLDGKYMYVVSYNGTFYCLSRDEASIQWTYRVGGIQRAAVSGDRVFLSDDQGFVHALNKKTGEKLWKFDLREHDLERSLAQSFRRQLKIPSAPLPFYGVLLVASSSGYLYALDEKTGKMRWRYWPGYGITAAMAREGRSIFVHSNFGNFYCLQPNFAFHE
jgi:outer membrane protein assembly factor BamB